MASFLGSRKRIPARVLMSPLLHLNMPYPSINKIKEVTPNTIILIMIDQSKIKTVINTLVV